MQKVVLAYSGGLDTSVAIHWLKETKGYNVVAVAVDVGEEKNYEAIREKALQIGAVDAIVRDAKREFVEEYIWPALKANALYQGKYYLATALARPLIAKVCVDVAHEVGASAVAHGATGKGNDQVRFDVSFAALDPSLEVIAPVREWGMSREEEIEYAERHGIPIPVTKEDDYSIDLNMWGRSIECGPLEDPNTAPPEDVFQLTVAPENAPDEPQEITVQFDRGVPVALNGEELSPVEMVNRANALGAAHGVGRVDMIEDRLVGIKSREVYECPGAVVLSTAHRELEALTVDRDTAQFCALVSQKYSELVYNGLWYSPLKEHLDALVDSVQRYVCGEVRLKLYKGSCTVVGRSSPMSLYRYEMATYDKEDQYQHRAGEGFSWVWGLPTRIFRQVQRERGG